MIEKAKKIAAKVHKGQKYGSEDYFDYHVMGVAEKVKERFYEHVQTEYWGSPVTCNCVIAAAILHDAVEDASDKEKPQVIQSIIDSFPVMVYELVIALTKDPDDEYADYILSLLEHPYSIVLRLIKLCDLEFNIDSDKGSRLSKYLLAQYILQ